MRDARPLGAAFVLDALWRRLGIDRALAEVLSGRRHRHDVERVLFALVANRAIEPAPKLRATEWATHDAAIPGLEALDEDRAYRAMDVLSQADAEGAVQEAVFFSVADLLNLEVDLLFFDTTSTYFEIEDSDEEQLRRFGHSKDHRPDRPQVVIGLAVTRTGIPVRAWVWPGNTADQAVIAEVMDDLSGWRLGRAVWVVDRGLCSEENLRYLRRGGGHWIAGQRMRSGEPASQAALARPGRYREVRDNLRVKEVRLGEGRAALDRLPQPRGGPARPRAARAGARADRVRARADRAPAPARGQDRHGARARRVRAQGPPQPLALPAPAALRQAASRPPEGSDRGAPRRQVPARDLRPRHLGRGRRARLQEPARGRALVPRPQGDPPHPPGLPPLGRADPRPRPDLLARAAARARRRARDGETWRRLRTELERLKLVTLSGPAGSVEQTTPLSDRQRAILKQLSVEPPPAVTALDPA